MSEKKPKSERRSGGLKIELEFEDAISAALRTPPPKPEQKPKKRDRSA